MTRQQRKCLDAIKALTVDGVSPSFDEIREHMGLKSKSGVHRIIHALKARGVIASVPYCDRSLTIRNEHAEAIPFDAMAGAVFDLIATGQRVYPSQVKAALINAYAGSPQ